VITNERQYKIANAEIRKFEEALGAAIDSAPPEGTDPIIHKAMQDALASQLDELREDVLEYEALRDGKIATRTFTSLTELPKALVEGRITARLTQKELAERVDLHEQQIQKYEVTGYAGVSLERVQKIADELGITFEEQVHYKLTNS
jgi:DNA-binding Xre family transcriptional regulator